MMTLNGVSVRESSGLQQHLCRLPLSGGRGRGSLSYLTSWPLLFPKPSASPYGQASFWRGAPEKEQGSHMDTG